MQIELDLKYAQGALLALTLLAGAAHVFLPDHWMPATLLGWRKGWRLRQLFAFYAVALALHTLLGFGLYLGLQAWLSSLSANQVLLACLGLIGAGSLIRSLRVPVVRRVFARASSGWLMFADVLGCLGPAEILVTVLYKSHALGMGYLWPITAFYLGSLGVGLTLAATGRRRYSLPGELPRALRLSEQRWVGVPVGACLVLGVALLMRISAF